MSLAPDPSTIKLYLAKGNPKGLRTAEISNWTGKALAAPRFEFSDLVARKELQRSGIYLLIGTDPETGKPALYIGEAEVASKRLKNHLDKDFWSHVYVFVSKDENLTKAHVRYLERQLIERASSLGAAKLLNTVSSGARLPEADKAEMEVFLTKMYQLLPILGANVLSEPEEGSKPSQVMLFCRIKNLVATGRRTAEGFIVYKGSQAVLKHRPSAKWAKGRRESLIKSGALEQQGDAFIFTRNIEFGSPSTAGAVIRGGSTNGLTAWKTDQGIALKEQEAENRFEGVRIPMDGGK
jgi:hypothetical protein